MTTFSPSADAPPEREPVRDELAPLRPARLVLDTSGHVGAALAAARESLDLDIDDIALVTRVRAPHLAAIEAFELDRLPARPFAVGYVRAYAQALGLDADMVVARFRAEAPRPNTSLRAPVGGDYMTRGRFGALALVVLALVAGVIGWNLLVHAKNHAHQAARTLSAPRPPAAPRLGPPMTASLGAPLPAPPEATTPSAYRTPGLAPPTPAAEAMPVGSPFKAQGMTWGAAPRNSRLVLQARGPTTLVVRAGGGGVVFARQLHAGDAWGATSNEGLTVEAGNPGAVEVFVGGLSQGPMPTSQSSIGRLVQPR